tara:strand:+ start:314 stop:688 length:375 start_codon:yes stop_codon:yes gene_type:complete
LTTLEPGPCDAIIQHPTSRTHKGPTFSRFLCAKGFSNEEDTSGALPIECHEPLPCLIQGTALAGGRFGEHLWTDEVEDVGAGGHLLSIRVGYIGEFLPRFVWVIREVLIVIGKDYLGILIPAPP